MIPLKRTVLFVLFMAGGGVVASTMSGSLATSVRSADEAPGHDLSGEVGGSEGAEILSHNLWVDVTTQTAALCWGEYSVEIRYQNRGTEDAHNAQIVFYAPNYPSGRFYTRLKDGSIVGDLIDYTLDTTDTGVLRKITFDLQAPLPPSSGTLAISFTLEILPLEECKSLSNCAAISSDEFPASEACQDVSVCPPDLVPRLEPCLLCAGVSNQIAAWVRNDGGMDARAAFLVCFYEGQLGGTPIHCESVRGLGCGESKWVSADWECTDVGTHTFYIYADTDNSIVEENEENNVDSTSCDCLDCEQGCDLAISKFSTADSTIAGGDMVCVSSGGLIYYVLTLRNGRIDACADVNVVDVLPEGIEGVSEVEPPAEMASPESLRWHLDEVAPGATVTFSFDARVRSDLAGYTPLTNCASVVCDNDANSGNNVVCATVIVCPDSCPPCPTVSISPSQVSLGDLVVVQVTPRAVYHQVSLTITSPNGETTVFPIDPDSLFPYQVWTDTFSNTDLIGTYTVKLHTEDLMGCDCDVTVLFFVNQRQTFSFNTNVVESPDVELKVSFDLDEDSHVTIGIYNVAGESIMKDFVNDHFSAGRHTKVWNLINSEGKPVAAGVYFFRMEAGSHREIKKVAVIK